MNEVRIALERIVKDRDFSISAAEALEGKIIESYPNDNRFEDLLDVIASYRPGGGKLLFDEKKLEQECLTVLRWLPTTKKG